MLEPVTDEQRSGRGWIAEQMDTHLWGAALRGWIEMFGGGSLPGCESASSGPGLGRLAVAAWPAACVLVAVGGLTGCGGADVAARSQIADFRNEIARIQADTEQLDDRLTALEMKGSKKKKPSEAARDANDRPTLEVVRLTPHSAASPTETAESDEPPVVIHAEGSDVPSWRRSSGEDKAATLRAKASEDYDRALELVRKKAYDRALEALAGFLVRYPDNPNADNAMYWRGECFYAKGDFARAAEQFRGVVARFPKGNKVPDALLKLGLCQQQMGESEKAKKTFATLRKSHPSSDAATKVPRE